MPRSIQSISIATAGIWALDVQIERQNNLTRFSNVKHKWRLPRRLRMHGAFLSPYSRPEFNGRLRYPRTTREGHLVLFVEYGEDPPEIRLPDDESAFRHALEHGRDWPPFTQHERQGFPTGPYERCRPSDKGRYMLGALRLTGGLQQAGALLLNGYWRAIFDSLGAYVGDDRVEDIKNTLQKRLGRADPTPLSTDDDWNRLAKIVAAEARRVRIPVTSLDFEQLRERHAPLIEKEREKLRQHGTTEQEEGVTDAQSSLAHSVQWLCGQGILHQGYEWRCRHCYHVNWAEISALKTALTCVVCEAARPAPVDEPWQFRLNGFLLEGLKEHGLLALIWCLVKLEEKASESFYFLGPHDLFIKRPDSSQARADREADIVCVVDGRVHLCEVKSSGRDIDTAPLVEVARRLRPDVVTLAVMEVCSTRLEQRLAGLRSGLSAEGMSVELLTLEDRDFREDAYLPH